MLKPSEDGRIDGDLRYIATSDEADLMQIPDNVRNCVSFIGYRKDGQEIYGGTAFWVALEEGGSLHFYLITAKHVIEKIKKKGDGKLVYVRINAESGPPISVKTNPEDWYYSIDDPYIDVAACILPTPDGSDVSAYPLKGIATKEVIDENEITIGEELFIAGLFSPHKGEDRNIPIIRAGNIAAMPEEKVRVRFLGDDVRISAYLIECRSIGGLSGSPVFVHLGTGQRRIKNINVISSFKRYYLLGLVHGHYDARELGSMDILDQDSVESKINMGIAIVVPAEDIRKTLDHPRLAEIRKKHANRQPEGVSVS